MVFPSLKLTTADAIALAALLLTALSLAGGVGYWMYRVVAELVELRTVVTLSTQRHADDHRQLSARVDRHDERLDAHDRRLDRLEPNDPIASLLRAAG